MTLIDQQFQPQTVMMGSCPLSSYVSGKPIEKPETHPMELKIENCSKDWFTFYCNRCDRVIHRIRIFCSNRFHEDGLVLKLNKKGFVKKVRIIKDTCVAKRYGTNRRLIHGLFNHIQTLRYMVATQPWLHINSIKDLQDNVKKLEYVFRKISRPHIYKGKKHPGFNIRNMIVVIDPIYKGSDIFYLHYNIVWDGSYIPKKHIEDLWGFHTFIQLKNKKKERSFIEHYLALRLTIMNLPDKTTRIKLPISKFMPFHRAKFLRLWLWLPSHKLRARNYVKALLDFHSFITHTCPRCHEKLEAIRHYFGIDPPVKIWCTPVYVERRSICVVSDSDWNIDGLKLNEWRSLKEKELELLALNEDIDWNG